MAEAWRYPGLRIVVLARAPVPGQVKTRLHAVLSPLRAAALHRRLLRHVLAVTCATGLAPVSLLGSAPHPWLRELARRHAVEFGLQREGDLGARMAAAVASALDDGARGVLLLGADCAEMDEPWLAQALAVLDRGEALLGPARDGGYVALGLCRPAPFLFAGMPWGSDRVLALSRARLRQAGWRWRELPPLGDIDRPEDLAQLPRLRRR